MTWGGMGGGGRPPAGQQAGKRTPAPPGPDSAGTAWAVGALLAVAVPVGRAALPPWASRRYPGTGT